MTQQDSMMISYHELRDLALECVATVTSSINMFGNEQSTDIEQKSSSSDYVTSLDRQIESGNCSIHKGKPNEATEFLGEGGLHLEHLGLDG